MVRPMQVSNLSVPVTLALPFSTDYYVGASKPKPTVLTVRCKQDEVGQMQVRSSQATEVYIYVCLIYNIREASEGRTTEWPAFLSTLLMIDASVLRKRVEG